MKRSEADAAGWSERETYKNEVAHPERAMTSLGSIARSTTVTD